jgi:predicted RNA-binding protein with PUA-like domain
MAYWLLKTEPGDYSYAELESDGETVWDGVKNNLALQHLRRVKRGDRALIYHTGSERAVVGEALVTSDPYADPEEDDPKLMVFDVRAAARWPRPLTLAEIKSDSGFESFDLVRLPRLSVVPVPAKLWRRLRRLGGLTKETMR